MVIIATFIEHSGNAEVKGSLAPQYTISHIAKVNARLAMVVMMNV